MVRSYVKNISIMWTKYSSCFTKNYRGNVLKFKANGSVLHIPTRRRARNEGSIPAVKDSVAENRDSVYRFPAVLKKSVLRSEVVTSLLSVLSLRAEQFKRKNAVF